MGKDKRQKEKDKSKYAIYFPCQVSKESTFSGWKRQKFIK